MPEIKVRALTSLEEARYSSLVVGMATCPVCDKPGVCVMNAEDLDGESRLNYLEDHYPIGGGELLCQGSKMLLSEL